jgi:hypothetical protein
MPSSDDIEATFPKLAASGYSLTSPESTSYNCVAWAAGDTRRWWWPDAYHTSYWPVSVPREETTERFVEVFVVLGYEPCLSGDFEPEFEKVAIYATAAQEPKHVARQLPSGHWTSKLGSWEDIEQHTLDGLAGADYGIPTRFLRRPVPRPA